MAHINDVVQLPNGSIGVVGDITNGLPCVYFVDSFKLCPEPLEVLSAPEYAVNGEITVWPDLGIITAIDGDVVSVDVEHTDIVAHLGPVEWIGHHEVPLWRVIRDNDPRIQRIQP